MPNAFSADEDLDPSQAWGLGSVSSLRTSGPPGSWMTAAFMVSGHCGLLIGCRVVEV